MSTTDKVKALATLMHADRKKIAVGLGISLQAVSNKYARDSFTAGDLIRVADALGVRLAFVDKQGQQIVSFSPDDAAPPRRSGQKAKDDTKN